MSLSDRLMELADKQMAQIARVIGSGSGWDPELIMIKGKAVAVTVIAEAPRPMDIAAFIVRLLKPEAYCFAAEAWMAFPEPGAEYRHGDIAKSEARMEILAQVWCVNGGEPGVRIFTIDRVNNKLDPFEAEMKSLQEQGGLKFSTKLPSSW
jgi:hypothetical protein